MYLHDSDVQVFPAHSVYMYMCICICVYAYIHPYKYAHGSSLQWGRPLCTCIVCVSAATMRQICATHSLTDSGVRRLSRSQATARVTFPWANTIKFNPRELRPDELAGSWCPSVADACAL